MAYLRKVKNGWRVEDLDALEVLDGLPDLVLVVEGVAVDRDVVVQDGAVQQCYRVTPGPDFVLVLRVADMPHYQAVAERLFTQDANVRNVRVFFATRCAKFGTQVPLRQAAEQLK